MSCNGACCRPARTRSSTRPGSMRPPACRYRSRGRGRVSLSRSSKVRMLADAHQVKQLLARIGEVLAQVIVDRDAFARQFGFQDLRDQRRAAAAGAARPGRLLQGAQGGAAGIDRGTEVSLGDIVAGADLRSVRQRRAARGGGFACPRARAGSAAPAGPAAADRSASSAASCRSRRRRRPEFRRAASCRPR